MKSILLIIALTIPVFGFSQQKIKKSRLEAKKKQLFAEIKMGEFILSPDDYIPYRKQAKDIDRIVFERDTINSHYPHKNKVHACVTERDGFDKNYSVGVIRDYLRSETSASVFVNVYMKDGSFESKLYILDFDNGKIGYCNDYEEADYDAFGPPFWYYRDGMSLEAL